MRFALRTGFPFVAAMLLCVSSATLFGQAVNGSIVGTVTDTSGGLIPSAPVTLTDVNTSISRTGQTAAAGYYSFPDVPPGTYKVTVDTVDCFPGGNAKLCGNGRTLFVASANPNSPNYNAACTNPAGCPTSFPLPGSIPSPSS